MKETFIVRTEWYDFIKELSTEEKSIMLDNLFLYHMGEENLINLNNREVNLVWKFIKPNLIRNIESYDKRRETSAENGKLGGRPKKHTSENLINLNKPIEEPNKPIKTLSVTVNEPVSVSVSDYVPDFVSQNREQAKEAVTGYLDFNQTEEALNEDTTIIDYFGMNLKIKEEQGRRAVIKHFLIVAQTKKPFPRKFTDTKDHLVNWSGKADLTEILNKKKDGSRKFNQAKNLVD